MFLAVISAFALNNWNDNRKDGQAESKILLEILNGLEKDSEDVKVNIRGHKSGLKTCEFWRKVIENEEVNLDTLQAHYFLLTRDFISIQNRSGYEVLKSKGFELIHDDSLRKDIISLYEFDYQVLEKFEEEYYEMQFQKSYFEELNHSIAPHFVFNDKGEIVGMELPLNLEKGQKRILLSYLRKIRMNRSFVLRYYAEVEDKIDHLKKEIAFALKERN